MASLFNRLFRRKQEGHVDETQSLINHEPGHEGHNHGAVDGEINKNFISFLRILVVFVF
jgi:hypothetical protein